ncbi:MAG: hypothetical protein Q4A21_03555 [bacterium]|nr:hypothetical protein [bacterium]
MKSLEVRTFEITIEQKYQEMVENIGERPMLVIWTHRDNDIYCIELFNAELSDIENILPEYLDLRDRVIFHKYTGKCFPVNIAK